MADHASPALCVLSVHAHPDDEASKGASTMALYGAEGVRTVLVTCTGGEAGEILNPAADSDEARTDLAAVRAAELDESVRIIGYDALHMLGYRDSGMAGTEPNAHPDSFANADLDEAVGRLVAIVRAERPQVIIGYARDRVYVHPDHLRVHEISVLAFERAGDPDWYPDAGEPWEPLEALLLERIHQGARAVDARLLRGAGRGEPVRAVDRADGGRRQAEEPEPTRPRRASTSATTSRWAVRRCSRTPRRSRPTASSSGCRSKWRARCTRGRTTRWRRVAVDTPPVTTASTRRISSPGIRVPASS